MLLDKLEALHIPWLVGFAVQLLFVVLNLCSDPTSQGHSRFRHNVVRLVGGEQYIVESNASMHGPDVEHHIGLRAVQNGHESLVSIAPELLLLLLHDC
jgi:hypothetical protein